MPLELGMAIAIRFMDPGTEHDWLVLVPKGHAYHRFVSDLAAFDLPTHNVTPGSVVARVMGWLVMRPEAVPAITLGRVLAALPSFEARKRELDSEWDGIPPWTGIVSAALEIARRLR